MAVAPDLIDRFRADLAALVGWQDHLRLGIAVSGGADSLALLLIASEALPDRIAAATVDHGLRAGAAEEAQFVAAICAERAIPHTTLTVAVEAAGDGLQAAARHARYVALEAWRRESGLSLVATAHHADDQAETLLMRASRGAGVSGLAGIRAVNGTLVRPLLGWRRAELESVVRAAGLTFVDDPSNRDPRFDRSRMRQLLADAPDLDVAGLASSAANLAAAAQALDWVADRLWIERVSAGPAEVRIDAAELPAELVHRLVRRALSVLGYQGRADKIAPLIARLNAGQPASIGAILARPGAHWVFSPAPPRRFP
ncbi:tRNA(Ile)-lysidine synthase [Sphingomonas laterariae]|uniref:tRNA(Ile)-lysidine synthase n=1 Tax=Edaphosphingomonas laterariae TaxID=861865 RepID=A0A239GWA1_9SPHN|nr:tRNA lysidine(34) synthetase TilS [Sphingomonas laterariae]SNS73397.1 tRNA(Ile)-lysidine synthase [Sphingomonas laterariae]